MGTVLFLTETASDRVISAAVKYIFKKPTMLKSQILACLVLGVLMINVAEGGKLKKLILMKMMAAQHQQGGYGGSSGGYGAMGGHGGAGGYGAGAGGAGGYGGASGAGYAAPKPKIYYIPVQIHHAPSAGAGGAGGYGAGAGGAGGY